MAARTAASGGIDRRLSVAPMMDRTDRFFRFFLRTLTRRTLLYTEMITPGAILHGDRDRYLAFDAAEHPVAIQLGGAEPDGLAESARIAAEMGYDEVNLNVGCPSDRVQSGRFGACLMAEPDLVADCVAAMRAAVAIPVTVKTRIGIDERDSYEELVGFVATVAGTGCTSFAIHARKAWLTGLSPKQNRDVPPLRYDVAARLKADFPDLEIVLNGGIRSLDEARAHLDTFDGAMIGRAAVDDPYLLAEADQVIFGEPSVAPSPLEGEGRGGGAAEGRTRSSSVRVDEQTPLPNPPPQAGRGYRASPPSREDAVTTYLPWMARELAAGVPTSLLVRPLIGLYHGQPGGRAWRRAVTEAARADDPARAIEAALRARRTPQLPQQARASALALAPAE